MLLFLAAMRQEAETPKGLYPREFVVTYVPSACSCSCCHKHKSYTALDAKEAAAQLMRDIPWAWVINSIPKEEANAVQKGG